MLRLTVISVLTIVLSVQNVQTRALKSLHIQGILESLQNQLLMDQLAEKKRHHFSVDDAVVDDYNAYSPKLNQDYLVRSLNKKKQIHQDRDDSDDSDDDYDRKEQRPQLLDQLGHLYDKASRELLKKTRSAKWLAALLDDRSDNDRDNRVHKSKSVKTLTPLLDNGLNDDKNNRHQKSKPISALASLLDNRQENDLSSYKSVYLVLDPEAVEKSHNKDKLGNLLSKLLNAVRQTNKRDKGDRKKERHYEGYAEDNLLGRRKGHDSKERYVQNTNNNSPERDYKPKRSRVERPSGGGSRTAIPYIGHRGDIYERDN